jgi:hypothetical protein
MKEVYFIVNESGSFFAGQDYTARSQDAVWVAEQCEGAVRFDTEAGAIRRLTELSTETRLSGYYKIEKYITF